jgi:hypothetical protein
MSYFKPLFLLLALIVIFSTALAEEGDFSDFTGVPTQLPPVNGKVLPPNLQTKLLLTALTYEKNLKGKAVDQFDIGILYFPWCEQSKKEAKSFFKALKIFQDKKIGGRSFNIFLFTYNGDAGIKEKIDGKHIEVLFIVGGEKRMLREIIALTQKEKILSWTNNTEYVSSCGVTMGVGLKENKPKIYLNFASAQREGVDFSAKFLRIAEIVDNK